MKYVVVTGNKHDRTISFEGIYTDEEVARKHQFLLQADGKNNSTQEYIDILQYDSGKTHLVLVKDETDGSTKITDSCTSRQDAESVIESLDLRDSEFAQTKKVTPEGTHPDLSVEYRLYIQTSALGYNLPENMLNPSNWRTDFTQMMNAIEELQTSADWVGTDAFVIHARTKNRSKPMIEAKLSQTTVSDPTTLEWNTPRNLP